MSWLGRMKIRPGRTVRRMQLKLHRWASEDSARRFKRVRVRRRLQRHRDPLPLPRGEHPGPWTPPLTAAEQRARHVESRMRGDTHVRFGRRARETDSGQPGHRARARPNRSDTTEIMPIRWRSPIVAGQRQVQHCGTPQGSSPVSLQERPLIGLQRPSDQNPHRARLEL